MKCTGLLTVIASLMFTGCAVRGPSAFRTTVNPSCLTAPVELQGCDFSSGAATCKIVKLQYRKGCEQIQVKSVKEIAEK
jgi:hypothetical protein